MFFERKSENSFNDAIRECPECSGSGEVINPNHYIADTNSEFRYIMCNRCHGTGRLIYEEERN